MLKTMNSPSPDPESRPRDLPRRFEPLTAAHMPDGYAISLDAYRTGGTDRFLVAGGQGERLQPMSGFEQQYTDIIDYIVRITHRIWEEKDIGYIYDTYSHDCRVWDDVGLQYGRDKIVADTIHTNNAFPDIRLVADEVIWAGDENIGFHTSHRTMIMGTNTGYSRYGSPTGRTIRCMCIANCISRHNEIFLEHVQYDAAGLIVQLGLDIRECAIEASAASGAPVSPEFIACEPKRMTGQGKPARVPVPDRVTDPEEFVRTALQMIWNRRDLSVLDRIYHPSIEYEGGSGRSFHGIGQIRSFILGLHAMFPNLAASVDDLYWMGNPEEGFLISVRWGLQGSHRGNGMFGTPTGREVHLWAITQWQIKDDRILKEWTIFNEFGVWMQLLG